MKEAMMASPAESTLIPIKRGRFLLPRDWAQERDWLIVTSSFLPCLLLFHERNWAPQREAILLARWPDNKWPSWITSEAQQSAFKRVLVGNSLDLSVSRKGSIQLPIELTRYAGIEYELLWVPKTQCAELWKPSTYKEYQAQMTLTSDTKQQPLPPIFP